jgi:hypothetical protein
LAPATVCAVVKSTKFFVVDPVPPFAIAIAVPLQTPLVMVPTPVKLELTTLLAKVVPVKVFELAAMVISALPSNATPLMFFVAANFVAVLALPVKAPVKFVAVTVLNPANEEVVAPKAIFVVPRVNELFAKLLLAIAVPLQIPLVIVPTEVKLELTTLLAKVVPVKVFASDAIVISPEPSKLTPLIARAVASFVAVLALPVKAPVKFVAVTVLSPANEDVVAPKAMFVEPIVKALFANLLFAIAVPLQIPLVIVPTEVKLELTTLLAKVVPVKVFASAAIVISPEPSKLTPLIARAVASFVAVLALPVKAPVNPVEVIELKPVTEVTVPPKVSVVEPKVVVLFANCALVIPAFAAISALTIVASVIFAEVIEPSLTPAEATRVST